MTPREAMEAALLDDPDDLVRHAAYADMLIEDGDPRGDDGALALAAHPDVTKLEHLSLDKNLLTAIGIEALAVVGHPISADQNFGGLHPFKGDL